MTTIDIKPEVLQAINKVFDQFEIEHGYVKDYSGHKVTCELSGCDRDSQYYINSPVYGHRYDTVYTYACVIHVGVLTLQTAAKWVEKELDTQYCKVCEHSAYACECDPMQAIGVIGANQIGVPQDALVQRKIKREAAGICAVCGGETEHNWEVHVAEMKAEREF